MSDVTNRIVNPGQGNQNLNSVNNHEPAPSGNVPQRLQNAQVVANAGNHRIVPQDNPLAQGNQNLAHAQQVHNPAPMVNPTKNGAYIASILESKNFRLNKLPDNIANLIKNTIESAKDEHNKEHVVIFCSSDNLNKFLGEELFTQFVNEVKTLPEAGLIDLITSLIGKYSAKAIVNAELNYLISHLSTKTLSNKERNLVIADLLKNENFAEEVKTCFSRDHFEALCVKYKNDILERVDYYFSLGEAVDTYKDIAGQQLSELTGIPLEVLRSSTELKNLEEKLETEQQRYLSHEKEGNFEDAFTEVVTQFVNSKNQQLQIIKQADFSHEKYVQISMLLLDNELPDGVSLDAILSHGQGGIGALLNSYVNPPEGFTKPSTEQIQEELKKTVDVMDTMYKQDMGENKWQALNADQKNLLRDLTTLIMFDKTPGLEAGLAGDDKLDSAFRKVPDSPQKHLFEQSIKYNSYNLITLLQNRNYDELPVGIKEGIYSAFFELKAQFGISRDYQVTGLLSLLDDPVLKQNISAKLAEKIALQTVAQDGKDPVLKHNTQSIHDLAREVMLETFRNQATYEIVVNICSEQNHLTFNSGNIDEKIKKEIVSELVNSKNFIKDIKNLNSRTEIENYITQNEQYTQQIALRAQVYLAAKHEFNNLFSQMINAENISGISKVRIFNATDKDFESLQVELLESYKQLPAQNRPVPGTQEFNTFIEDRFKQILSPRVNDLKVITNSGLPENLKLKYTDMILSGNQPEQLGVIVNFAKQFAHFYDAEKLQSILDPLARGKSVNMTKLQQALSEFENLLDKSLPQQLDLNRGNLTENQIKQLSFLKDLTRQLIFQENPELGKMMSQIPLATREILNEKNKALMSLVNAGRAVYASEWMSQDRCDAILHGDERMNGYFDVVFKHGAQLFDSLKQNFDHKLHSYIRHYIGSANYDDHTTIRQVEAEFRKITKYSRHWKEFTYDTCPEGVKQYLKNHFKKELDVKLHPDFKEHINFIEDCFSKDVCRSLCTVQNKTFYFAQDKDFDKEFTKLLLKGRDINALTPQEIVRLNKQKLGITSLLHQGDFAGIITLNNKTYNDRVPGANVLLHSDSYGLQIDGSESHVGIELSDDGKSCTLTYSRVQRMKGNGESTTHGKNAFSQADNVHYCYKIELNIEGDDPIITDATMSQSFMGAPEKFG